MIERSEVDGVAVVRLAHGKVNALDLELLAAITATFAELDAGPSRAIVLTGTGRAFSAGVDLRRTVAEGADYVRAFLPALSEAFLAVFEAGKPVVAAVNGHAIAGGAILASACDRRVMGPDGRFGVTELRVGVPFPPTALELLGYAIGERAARDAVFAADTVDAPEALRRGYVDALVTSADEVVATAVAAAGRLAEEVPPDTYRFTKGQAHEPVRERLARLRPVQDPQVEALWLTGVADGRIERFMAGLAR
jgi:enoyl-CoA hydratase